MLLTLDTFLSNFLNFGHITFFEHESHYYIILKNYINLYFIDENGTPYLVLM
jgi:hypothetical protein